LDQLGPAEKGGLTRSRRDKEQAFEALRSYNVLLYSEMVSDFGIRGMVFPTPLKLGIFFNSFSILLNK